MFHAEKVFIFTKQQRLQSLNEILTNTYRNQSNYSIICVTLNTELNTVDKRRFGAQTAV